MIIIHSNDVAKYNIIFTANDMILLRKLILKFIAYPHLVESATGE
jgi:hypothetical protein